MLHLLMSLPEPNLLTFLFLLDHLRRYTAPGAPPSFEEAAVSPLPPTLVSSQLFIDVATHEAGSCFTPPVDL